MNDHLSHLRGHERAAVSECVGRLRQAIVIPELDWSLRDEIRLTAARVSLEYDVLLNTHILDQPRWRAQMRYQDTLWREVQQDGVSLL